MKKTLVTIVLLAVFSPFYAQVSDAKLKMIDSLMHHFEKNDKLFGAITLSQNGKVIFNKAYGYENDEIKKTATLKTKYRIGSISKMYTSVMILQLIEEGKLTFETPLANYYKEIPNAEKITIKDLLCHQSGIFNFTNDTNYLNYYTKEQSKRDMLKIMESYTPSFKPKEKNSYSNSNYILLGYILEDITSKNYNENLQQRIVKPLKLTNTYFGKKAKTSNNEAFSYSYNGEDWDLEKQTHMSVPHGAGAVVSTTYDMTKFIEGLFAYKLLSKTSLHKMIDLKNNYGLGIFVFPFGEKKAHGHNGGIDGFHSFLGYFKNSDLTISTSFNGLNYNSNKILIDVLSICFEDSYSFPDLKKVVVKNELLSQYEGVYSSEGLPLKITITKRGGNLEAQATGQSSFLLENVNDTTFKFDQAGVVILFNKNESTLFYDLTLKQGGGEFKFIKEN